MKVKVPVWITVDADGDINGVSMDFKGSKTSATGYKIVKGFVIYERQSRPLKCEAGN